jgi:hypothetical protein
MDTRITIKDVDISLEGSGTALDGRISGAESASITISAEDTVHYEAGGYMPVEIVDGKISIKGELSKAWLNNDLFKLLCPVTNLGGSLNAVLKPTFTLRGKVINAKSPKREVLIYGVKFNSIGITNLAIDSVATQPLPFNATGYQFLD